MSTYVVVGGGYWGQGTDLPAAKRRFTSAGGRLSGGYGIYEFDAQTKFEGIDNYGRYHFTGNEPTLTVIKAKKKVA